MSPCPGPGSSWAGPMCLGLQGRNFAMTLPSVAGLVWRRPCRPVTQASLPGHFWHLGLSDSWLWGCPGFVEVQQRLWPPPTKSPQCTLSSQLWGPKMSLDFAKCPWGQIAQNPQTPSCFLPLLPAPEGPRSPSVPIPLSSSSSFSCFSRGGSGWGFCLPRPPPGRGVGGLSLLSHLPCLSPDP